MIKTYIKKQSLKIQAVQWKGNNLEEVQELQLTSNHPCSICQYGTKHELLIINSLEGNYLASIGDYIIRGVKGEFYPCKPEKFKTNYVEVTE